MNRLTSTFVVLLGVVFGSALARDGDATLTPGASGSEVVEAVVRLVETSCIFPEDKQFLRRLAYVESYDGQDPKTYRDGYHGGIWQVDSAFFDVTKAQAGSSTLCGYVDAIRVQFGIDWTRVTWDQLRMPLYSGLGSRLYLAYQSRAISGQIPRSIEEQANFWKSYYRPSGDVNHFIELANQLERGCESSNGADIIFVLDGSGSIGATNFGQVKTFVKDVVRAFDIGSDKNRIGVIQFGTAVYHEFYLRSYNTSQQVLNAVDRITYRGGSTYTHLALNSLVDVGFTEANGARPLNQNHPRVGIVLTDGASSNRQLTIEAAERCHSLDVTLFSIGVGSGVNMAELEAIASDPICMHLFLLNNFNEIDDLVSAIQKKTCDAPIIIGGQNGSDISGSLPPGGDQNCKIRIPVGGTTVKLRALSGHAFFYTSRVTYPSESFYDHKLESTNGVIDAVFIPSTANEETIEYCNIKGDNGTESNITIGLKPGDGDFCASSPCRQGECVDEGDTYWCDCHPGYTGERCESEIDECAPSPCQHGTCNDHVNGYICHCSPGWSGLHCEIDIDECRPSPCQNHGSCLDGENSYTCICAPGWTGQHCNVDIDDCSPNPCQNGGLCFDGVNSYRCECLPGWTGNTCGDNVNECASNPCQNGGLCQDGINGYVCACTPGWIGAHCEEADGFTCQHNNPCTPENIAAGRLYHPHIDPFKFIQCDLWGQCFEMPCAPGTRWDQDLLTCVV